MAASDVREDALVLCHGGPIATPEDVQHVLSRTTADGFYGASSMERLPTERAMTDAVREFTALRPGPQLRQQA